MKTEVSLKQRDPRQQLGLLRTVQQFANNVVVGMEASSSKLNPWMGQCENPLDVFEQSDHLVFNSPLYVGKRCAGQHVVNVNDLFHVFVQFVLGFA